MAKRIYHYGRIILPLALFVVALSLVAIGLAKDASISEKFYGGSGLLTTLIGVIAPFPFFAFWGASGSLIGIALRKKENSLPWYSYLIGALMGIASGVTFGCLVLSAYLESLLLSLLLGILVVLLIAIPLLWAEKEADKETCLRLACLIIGVVLLGLTLLLTMRLGFGRYPYSGGEAEAEGAEATAFPATASFFAAAALAGVPLLRLFPFDEDKSGFYGNLVIFLLALLSIYGSLVDGSSFLSGIGFSLAAGSFLAILFSFFFLAPLDCQKEGAKPVRHSQVTPGIRRREVRRLQAEAEANFLRMRRKNNSFHAVVPAEEISLLNRRRNLRHHR